MSASKIGASEGPIAAPISPSEVNSWPTSPPIDARADEKLATRDVITPLEASPERASPIAPNASEKPRPSWSATGRIAGPSDRKPSISALIPGPIWAVNSVEARIKSRIAGPPTVAMCSSAPPSTVPTASPSPVISPVSSLASSPIASNPGPMVSANAPDTASFISLNAGAAFCAASLMPSKPRATAPRAGPATAPSATIPRPRLPITPPAAATAPVIAVDLAPIAAKDFANFPSLAESLSESLPNLLAS